MKAYARALPRYDVNVAKKSRFCTSCGELLDPKDKFCAACGAPRKAAKDVPASEEVDAEESLSGDSASPAQGASSTDDDEAAPFKPPSALRLGIAAVVGPLALVSFFLLSTSKGCSSTEGTLVAKGEPLGDFTFTPHFCKSGQHESFWGVFILGESASAGGLKLVADPDGRQTVHLEIPGSCKGLSDADDDCTIVPITPEQCTTFTMNLRKTNRISNDIRLLDGDLKLDCTLEGQGHVSADIKFSSCD